MPGGFQADTDILPKRFEFIQQIVHPAACVLGHEDRSFCLSMLIKQDHGVFVFCHVDATVVHTCTSLCKNEARQPQFAMSLSALFVLRRRAATCLYETSHGAEATALSTRRDPQANVTSSSASTAYCMLLRCLNDHPFLLYNEFAPHSKRRAELPGLVRFLLPNQDFATKRSDFTENQRFMGCIDPNHHTLPMDASFLEFVQRLHDPIQSNLPPASHHRTQAQNILST